MLAVLRWEVSTPARTRWKRRSLVSSATVPPARAAWARRGERAIEAATTNRRPVTAERKPNTLPPVVTVPSKSNAAISGMGEYHARNRWPARPCRLGRPQPPGPGNLTHQVDNRFSFVYPDADDGIVRVAIRTGVPVQNT